MNDFEYMLMLNNIDKNLYYVTEEQCEVYAAELKFSLFSVDPGIKRLANILCKHATVNNFKGGCNTNTLIYNGI